tara:strand:+ start:1055 stop:1933 length:879 start_codon:yes stop_codon:yes gene_type:complete
MRGGFTFVDAVNFPATGQTGDDRYGFDESAGTAWVVDGATDVGTRRVMPAEAEESHGFVQYESDAAWYAEALSTRLMSPPRPGEAAKAYLEHVIRDVSARAQAAAVTPLDAEPRHNLPSAGGIWARRDGDAVEFATLGDCMGIVRTGGHTHVIGNLAAVKAEHATNREQLARPEGKEGGYASARDDRNRMNTEGAHWVFSIHPEAAARADIQRIPLSGESHILLMSDGFFRLVEPYKRYDASGLMDAALKHDDVLDLMTELRAQENNPEDDARIGRLKTRDDACALLLKVSA